MRQIRALRIISEHGVKNGDLGGFIESELNLSHEGNAWVSGNAQVSGNAKVYGNALVSWGAKVMGNAKIYGDARVFENAWISGDAWVCGDAVVKHSSGCFHLPLNPDSITITNRIQIGCHQYTFEEFRGSSVEDALAENLTVDQYKTLRKIVIPIMEMLDESSARSI